MSPKKLHRSLLISAVLAFTGAAYAGDKARIVPMIQTPMTQAELVSALRDGHKRAFGTDVTRNRLAMAWGQVAFENGQGSLTYNHNLGNVVAAAGQDGYRVGDHQPYRSFADNVAGAEAYWHVIGRCQVALARFDKGDSAGAAAALKRCGYFEADLGTYTKGFSWLYRYAHDTVIPEEERESSSRADALATAESILDPGSDHQL